MKVWVFCLLVIVLFFLIVPFKFKSKVKYNVLKNKGKIKFYFFKFNFLSFDFKIKPKYIFLTTKKGKNFIVPLEFSKQASVEMADLTYLLFDKTTFHTLKINFDIGVKNNAFLVALIYGFLQTFSSIILSILKTKKLDTIVSNKINTVYTKNNASVDLSASLSISLIDLAWAIMQYKIKIKRVGEKYETR